MLLVEAKALSKHYWLGKVLVTALRDVSLQITTGDFVAVAGPSGSGKTTLLHLIGCIERPTSGVVCLRGIDTRHLSVDAQARLRGECVGFIFQRFNLLPVLTALENVEYPLLRKHLSARDRRARALAALEQVGLAPQANHKPLELSGGQQQRVAIARAVVTDPQLILADEPTANLDRRTGQNILELMKSINQRSRTTFLFSTHDPRIVQMADRVITLLDGAVV